MAGTKRKLRVQDGASTTIRNSGVCKTTEQTRAQRSSKTTRVVKAVTLGPATSTSLNRSPATSSESDCEVSHNKPVDLGRHTSVKRRREDDDDPATPHSKRFKDALPPTPSGTPSKTCSTLDSKKPPSTTHLDASAYSTPPATPHHDRLGASLPKQIQDLVSLHTSFLGAISLFLAHHGLSSSLLLSDILRQTTKVWKRRHVTLVDVQKLLAILNTASDTVFELISSGDDSTVHLKPAQHSIATIISNHQTLCAQFNARLQRRWDRWAATSGSDTADQFLESLPMVEIQLDDASSGPARLSKGLSRLNLLKQESAETRAENKALEKTTVPVEAKTQAGVTSRGSSLLDRVLAKQRYLESCPQGPTKEQIQRNAALDRIEEATMMLGLLAGTRPRVSFSMQTMVKHLQDSMRNPISNEQAEMCMDLMANQVAPNFVSLVKMGAVSGVVVKRGGKPTVQAIQAAIRAARAL